MTLIEQIKADREAGTQGPWKLKFSGGDTRIYMNGSCEMCDMTYYPWTPENIIDWQRIARVPDMEAALMAAEELVRVSQKWVLPGDVEKAIAAYRKATEAAQ